MYLHLIYSALRDPIKKALEALIMQQFQGIEFELPPFAKDLIARGEIKGERKGRLEGRLEEKREALRKVAVHAGLVLSPDQHARIEACEDLDALSRWFDRAFTAKTPDELFD